MKAGIGSRSHCLLGDACLALSSIDARGNDDIDGIDEGLEESLRRRLEILSENYEAKIQ